MDSGGFAGITGECAQQQVLRTAPDNDAPHLTALRKYLGSVVLLGYVQPLEVGGGSVLLLLMLVMMILALVAGFIWHPGL